MNHQYVWAVLIALALAGPAFAGETCELSSGGNGGAVTNPAEPDSFACGASSEATGDNAIALGPFSIAEASDSVAVGTSASAVGVKSTAVGSLSVADADQSTAVGHDSTALGTDGTAIGFQTLASKAGTTALGAGAHASAVGSVALGAESVADRTASVSVGRVGDERQIVNVADATEATDAINLRQLNASIQQANTQQLTQVRTEIAAGDATTLQAANAYTDQRINQLAGFDFSGFERQLEDFDRRLRGQDVRLDRNGAMNAAMTQMAMNGAGARSERGRIAMGAGFHEGESALAVGYAKPLGKRGSFSLGAAFSGSERSAGVGFGLDL